MVSSRLLNAHTYLHTPNTLFCGSLNPTLVQNLSYVLMNIHDTSLLLLKPSNSWVHQIQNRLETILNPENGRYTYYNIFHWKIYCFRQVSQNPVSKMTHSSIVITLSVLQYLISLICIFNLIENAYLSK